MNQKNLARRDFKTKIMAKKDTSSFEQKLLKSADKLRKNIDTAEYKYVALGLVFLKYISESFNEKYEELKTEQYSDL